jgi:hypothetical protein
VTLLNICEVQCEEGQFGTVDVGIVVGKELGDDKSSVEIERGCKSMETDLQESWSRLDELKKKGELRNCALLL